MRSIFILLLASLFFSGCLVVQENPLSGRKRAYAYSWDQEVELGKSTDAQIVAQYGLYDDPKITAYVTGIGEKVLANSHMRGPDASPKFRETPFTFRVLDSPIVNAFALPGGYVYVTRGLLTHLNNEAQLAVVLGHEVGHVAGRHASIQALEQKAGQIALIGGAVVGQELFGVDAQSIMGLGNQAAQLLFLRYSRDNERESDKVGVEYAAKSGYKSSEASEFFNSLKRLSEQAGGTIPSHLSSHPDPGDREQSMFTYYDEWKSKGFDQKVVGTEDYLNQISGMMIGENPRNGFVEGNAFYHPDLKFQFSIPANWQIMNEPTRVILVAPEQKAIGIMDLADVGTAKEAVQQVTAQEGISVRSSSDASVNGLSAFAQEASAQQENGVLGLYVAAVKHNGAVFRFLMYTDQGSFSGFLSALKTPSSTFANLTDNAKLNVQPLVLKPTKTSTNGTLSSFISPEVKNSISLTELAIINQVEENESIPAGTWIKLPVKK